MPRKTTLDAISAFAEMADPAIVARAAGLVASEVALWVADPQVENVFGLVYYGTNRALVVVYLNGEHPDFEAEDL